MSTALTSIDPATGATVLERRSKACGAIIGVVLLTLWLGGAA